MAIVADHLGLSWTELARELDFSVEEIDSIRLENPNSLTAQSFMLLKKWVHRDSKNATTDTLTAVLTKINRLDIVTLLEGPIFDYGYHQVDAELQTPTVLHCAPPTLLRSDDFLRDGEAGGGVVDPPSRPSELPLVREPPLVRMEDTSESPDNDRRAAKRRAMFEGAYAPYERQGGRHEEEEEDEEEMTQERLQSLLEDIKLEEEGLEDEEMTEEKVHAILEQVRQAEKDLCSLPGWRGGDAETVELGPASEEGSPDSLADSLEQPPARSSEKEEEEQGDDRSARRVQPGNGNNKPGRKSHS